MQNKDWLIAALVLIILLLSAILYQATQENFDPEQEKRGFPSDPKLTRDAADTSNAGEEIVNRQEKSDAVFRNGYREPSSDETLQPLSPKEDIPSLDSRFEVVAGKSEPNTLDLQDESANSEHYSIYHSEKSTDRLILIFSPGDYQSIHPLILTLVRVNEFFVNYDFKVLAVLDASNYKNLKNLSPQDPQRSILLNLDEDSYSLNRQHEIFFGSYHDDDLDKPSAFLFDREGRELDRFTAPDRENLMRWTYDRVRERREDRADIKGNSPFKGFRGHAAGASLNSEAGKRKVAPKCIKKLSNILGVAPEMIEEEVTIHCQDVGPIMEGVKLHSIQCDCWWR